MILIRLNKGLCVLNLEWQSSLSDRHMDGQNDRVAPEEQRQNCAAQKISKT